AVLATDDQPRLFAEAIHLLQRAGNLPAGLRPVPPLLHFAASAAALIYSRLRSAKLRDLGVLQLAQLPLVLLGDALLLGLLVIQPLPLDIDSRPLHLLALGRRRGRLLGRPPRLG